jgi:glucosamine-6-phosphate deaminase
MADQLSKPIDCFLADALTVNVYESEQDMALAAAQITQTYLIKTIASQGQARIVFATGKSQLIFLKNLINLGGVNWQKITCFHLDEYLGLTPDHPGSLRYYLQENIGKLFSAQQFHYIQGEALEPLQECDRYTQLLKSTPIDLVLLGIGQNGHIAFNDPSVANFQDPYTMKLVRLDKENRQQQYQQGWFPSLHDVPQYAFTLTIPTICQAKKIICLAPDVRKADIVKTMLTGAINPACPVSILRRQTQATLFLDIHSASLLDSYA